MTLEEQFLLKLYTLASQTGDPETPFSATYVGNALRLSPNKVKNISNILAQTNFIRKIGDGEICLTPHGLKLVEKLKNS